MKHFIAFIQKERQFMFAWFIQAIFILIIGIARVGKGGGVPNWLPITIVCMLYIPLFILQLTTIYSYFPTVKKLWWWLIIFGSYVSGLGLTVAWTLHRIQLLFSDGAIGSKSFQITLKIIAGLLFFIMYQMLFALFILMAVSLLMLFLS